MIAWILWYTSYPLKSLCADLFYNKIQYTGLFNLV